LYLCSFCSRSSPECSFWSRGDTDYCIIANYSRTSSLGEPLIETSFELSHLDFRCRKQFISWKLRGRECLAAVRYRVVFMSRGLTGLHHAHHAGRVLLPPGTKPHLTRRASDLKLLLPVSAAAEQSSNPELNSQLAQRSLWPCLHQAYYPLINSL
jgi:hypothetical protein